MEKETVDLNPFNIIRRNLWIILSITLIITVISAYITFFTLTPIYQAKTQILIMGTTFEESNLSSEEPTIEESTNEPKPDIAYESRLVETYIDLIQSNRILVPVNQALEEFGYTVSGNQITVENEKESQVLTILVEDSDPSKAAVIADTIANIFEQEIIDIMTIDNVQVLMDAKVNPTPIRPIPFLIIGVSAVLGFIIALWIGFFRMERSKQRTI